MERGAKGEKQFAISITGSTYLQAGLSLSLAFSPSLSWGLPDPVNGVSPDRVARFPDDSQVPATVGGRPYTVKDIISYPVPNSVNDYIANCIAAFATFADSGLMRVDKSSALVAPLGK